MLVRPGLRSKGRFLHPPWRILPPSRGTIPMVVAQVGAARPTARQVPPTRMGPADGQNLPPTGCLSL